MTEATLTLAKHQAEGLTKLFTALTPRLLYIDSVKDQEPLHGSAKHRDWARLLAEAWASTGWLFSWATGAGKTLGSLEVMREWEHYLGGLSLSTWLRAALARPFLIVGPARNRHVWEGEMAKWHPDMIGDFIVLESDRDFEAGAELVATGRARGVIASYTGLARNWRAFAHRRLAFGFSVFDEVHYLGNTTTERSKALYRIAALREDGTPGIGFRLGLSATPFMNHVEQLWPVLAFLNGYVTMGATGRPRLHSPPYLWGEQNEFTQAYCVTSYDNWGRARVRGRNLYHNPQAYAFCALHKAEACPNLHPRMQRLNTHRVTQSEAWPNLPQPEPQWMPVDLGQKQAELYGRILELAQYGNGAINKLAYFTYAFETAASGAQLRESLCASSEPGPRQLLVSLGHVSEQSSKLDALVELMRDLDAPALVFTGFARFARQIARDPRLVDYEPVLLAGTGNLSAKTAEQSFQTGRSRLFVTTTMGSTGLTLSRASYVIVAGFLAWSPFDVLQAIGRVLRPDQKAERVMVYMMYAPGTVEQWLMDKLAGKLEVGGAVLDGHFGASEDLNLNIGRMNEAEYHNALRGRS